MKHLSIGFIGGFLGLALLSAAQVQQTFTGTITDSECARGDHSSMQMGPTDADCVIACVELHGAAFVLYDGTTTYKLDDQRTPEQFAGQRVTVTGTLDAETSTIQVDSMTAVTPD